MIKEYMYFIHRVNIIRNASMPVGKFYQNKVTEFKI